MHWLAPLAVAIPLIVAAAMAAASFIGRRVADAITLATAGATAGLCLTIFVHVGTGHEVYSAP